MNRETAEEDDREAGRGGTSMAAIRWETTAAELAREFGAPVAIFDPRRGAIARWWERLNRSSPRSTSGSSEHAGQTNWPRGTRSHGNARSIPREPGFSCHSRMRWSRSPASMQRSIRRLQPPSGMSFLTSPISAPSRGGPSALREPCGHGAIRSQGG